MLRRCIATISPDGSVGPMTAALRTSLEEITTEMASRGLRTLCITYRDFPADAASNADSFELAPDTDLVCCAIVGIKVKPSTFDHTYMAAEA